VQLGVYGARPAGLTQFHRLPRPIPLLTQNPDGGIHAYAVNGANSRGLVSARRITPIVIGLRFGSSGLKRYRERAGSTAN
jgi:hypothetical protein